MTLIRAVREDITTMTTDAIVNAANRTLLGGGGVDGAIHYAAGPELLEACKALPEVRPGVRCETGEACITPGFKLPARFVIHTVGPIYGQSNLGDDHLLVSCHRRSIKRALENGLTSIAFPAISCGVYGFPKPRAARIGVQTLRASSEQYPQLKEIVLVAFDAEMLQLWEAELAAPA